MLLNNHNKKAKKSFRKKTTIATKGNVKINTRANFPALAKVTCFCLSFDWLVTIIQLNGFNMMEMF